MILNNVIIFHQFSCVFIFSRSKHNIDGILNLFLSIYNLIPMVDKNHKTNILKVTHKLMHIYAADPNEIQKMICKTDEG